jgi:ubiquinone/menaquinone biosynthesis C-methylase UbiE
VTQSAPELRDISEHTPSNLGPVVDGLVVDQRFGARSDWLTGVSLLVGLFAKQIHSRVRVSILDDRRETVLRVVEADSSTFVDNTWQRFSFEPIRSSLGRHYWIRFETDAVDREQAMTLWTNNAAAEVCLRNGEPSHEAFCFVTHYISESVGVRTETFLGPLDPSDALRQRIVARANFLDSVRLWICSAGEDTTARVRLTIEDEHRAVELRRVEASVADFRSGRWEELRFDPIEDSEERIYWLRIEVASADPARSVTFWANSTVFNPSEKNGESCGATLCFKTGYGRRAKGPSSSEYCCVSCSSPVEFEWSADTVRCPACDARYPLVDGVIPILLDDALGQSNFYGDMFGRDAATYNDTYKVNPEFGRWVLGFVLQHEPRLRSAAGGSILEIGAGAGQLTRALGEGALLPYRKLYVSDLSVEMLRVNWALRTEPELHDRARYLDTNVLNLPFPDASLDLVTGFDILHHVLDYPAGLREIARVLKPGAACVLLEPFRDPYRVISFICWLVKRSDEITPEDRRVLDDWTECFHTLVRHNDANDHDAVAHVDDKYFFDRSELRVHALRSGFADMTECNVLDQPRRAAGVRETVFANMCMDFFRGVGLGEAGLKVAWEICAEMDAELGDLLIRDYPANIVFLFWKPE